MAKQRGKVGGRQQNKTEFDESLLHNLKRLSYEVLFFIVKKFLNIPKK